jgi:osmotically-inducible protein OsmY
VISALRRDDYLTGLPIVVSVKNGDVTLTGGVGNSYEQERAMDQAYLVDNVKSVKNDLSVEWWEERGVREKAPLPTKEQLAQAVRDELYQDLRITPYDVTVDASYGNVTLRGAVSSYYQKQIAERDARDVVGVAWVSDLLSVRAAIRSDGAVLDDVRATFDSDYSLNGQDIDVRVSEGKVTLSGNVNEYYEKLHAADVASKVRGVWDVVNNIEVNWHPQFTDASLQQRIKDRLSYDGETRWVADRISVKMKDGVATLTGTVYLWSERDEAGRVALLTDGVLSVNNRLTVREANYPWDEWNDGWAFLP